MGSVVAITGCCDTLDRCIKSCMPEVIQPCRTKRSNQHRRKRGWGGEGGGPSRDKQEAERAAWLPKTAPARNGIPKTVATYF